MKINPEIFKAYDIRGIYGQDFEDDFAYKLGKAYAIMRKKELPEKSKVVLAAARDMRISSSSLSKNLIQGMLEGGVDVFDLGLNSTPTFYFGVAHYGYDGGIIVSASHNPKEYNGFKIVREGASPVGRGTGMEELKELILEEKPIPIGSEGFLESKKDVLRDHADYSLKFSDISKIKPLKIVIDPANSMGSLYMDELFGRLNCQVIRINWELDGSFPNHEADPLKFENMSSLQEKIKLEKADLGIATDGDGDRIFFVDNKGEIVEPGILRAILSKIFIKEKPGAKIAYDIRPGKITPDVILENGGVPIITPVGHTLIKNQSVKEGAYFAGESSGHFFLSTEDGFFEVPMIVTLKILEDLSKSGVSFSEYVKPYKKYFHSGEINSEVADVQGKINFVREKYSDGKQNSLDGISVEYENWWFNLRGSNTEPKIRLTVEARSRELMEEKRDELLKIIRN